MDFIDLKTPYRRLRERINAHIQAVLDHGSTYEEQQAQIVAALKEFVLG